MNGAAQPPSGDNGLELYDDKGRPPSNSAAGGKSEGAVWYVARPDGQREGPLPLAILRGRAASGQLQPTDLLWTQGFASWMPARSVPDLYGPSSGSPSGKQSSPSMSGNALNASMLRNFVSGIASPGFLRITGRVFGVLSIVTLLLSMPFWFFGYSWFTNALLFAVVFVACEALAQIIESQRRIEAMLQSRSDTREAGR
jgi:hypothetical protein